VEGRAGGGGGGGVGEARGRALSKGVRGKSTFGLRNVLLGEFEPSDLLTSLPLGNGGPATIRSSKTNVPPANTPAGIPGNGTPGNRTRGNGTCGKNGNHGNGNGSTSPEPVIAAATDRFPDVEPDKSSRGTNGNGTKGNGANHPGETYWNGSQATLSMAEEAGSSMADVERFKVICPDCQNPLRFAEGCIKCEICGYSHC